MVCSLAPTPPKGFFITPKDRNLGGSIRDCNEIARNTCLGCSFRSSSNRCGVVEPLLGVAELEEGKIASSKVCEEV